ncbi:hypothetical protein ABPG75_004146 [Micractinium tetrahymenae]
MPSLTSNARALHSCRPFSYAALRPATSKVTLFHGSPDAWMQHQTQRLKADSKATACPSGPSKAAAAPCFSRAGSAIAAMHVDDALTADEYPSLHGAAPAAPHGVWAARLAAAAPAAPASPDTPAADGTHSAASEQRSPTAPSTPAAADVARLPFADEVAAKPADELAPSAAATPAAKAWQIPARRLDAPALIQAGCAYDPAAVTLALAAFGATDSCQQPLPAPTTPATTTSATTSAKPSATPYKVPQRRGWDELVAAAEAGRPGRPCAWPQLTAGPQRLTAVWDAAPCPIYRMALFNWSANSLVKPSPSLLHESGFASSLSLL